MPVVHANLEDWAAAGGDPERLELVRRVGRVAPFVDQRSRCVAAVHPDRPSVGTIADWIGGPEVLRAAESWLADQGCDEIRAPMWLCPWLGLGANLGPLDTESLLFEPTEPGAPWEAAGYSTDAQYASILASHGPSIAAGMDAAAGLSTRGWSLRPLDLTDDYEASVEVIHGLVHRAHEGTRGFTRMPLDVITRWYKGMAEQLASRPQLSRVALTPDGEAVGFILAFPEPRNAGLAWFQILALAVVPEHRHRGLASWMVAVAHEGARKAGIEGGVHAMVRRDKGTKDTAWYRGDIVRRYALFSRPTR